MTVDELKRELNKQPGDRIVLVPIGMDWTRVREVKKLEIVSISRSLDYWQPSKNVGKKYRTDKAAKSQVAVLLYPYSMSGVN